MHERMMIAKGYSLTNNMKQDNSFTLRNSLPPQNRIPIQNNSNSIKTQTIATPAGQKQVTDNIKAYGANSIRGGADLKSSIGALSRKQVGHDALSANIYNDNPYEMSTLDFQRSNSLAESTRLGFTGHKFQKSTSNVDSKASNILQQNRQSNLSDLHVRGVNQKQLRKLTLLCNVQNNKIKKIGVVVNPALNSQPQLQKSQNKFDVQQPKILADHKHRVKHQLLEQINLKFPDQLPTSNSRNNTQYSFDANLEKQYEQNTIQATPQTFNQEKNLFSNAASQSQSTDIGKKNLLAKLTASTNSVSYQIDRNRSSQSNQPTVSMNNRQIQQQTNKMHPFNQHAQTQDKYKKGEMMNQIISDRMQLAKISSYNNVRSSFKFDKHLSKNGQTNLNKYYQKREQLQNKVDLSYHHSQGDISSAQISNELRFQGNFLKQSSLIDIRQQNKTEVPSIQQSNHTGIRVNHPNRIGGTQPNFDQTTKQYQLVSSRKDGENSRHRANYQARNLIGSQARNLVNSTIKQHNVQGMLTQQNGTYFGEIAKKQKEHQVLPQALRTYKSSNRPLDMSPSVKKDQKGKPDRSRLGKQENTLLKKHHQSHSQHQLQQFRSQPQESGGNSSQMINQMGQKEQVRRAQDIITKSLQDLKVQNHNKQETINLSDKKIQHDNNHKNTRRIDKKSRCFDSEKSKIHGTPPSNSFSRSPHQRETSPRKYQKYQSNRKKHVQLIRKSGKFSNQNNNESITDLSPRLNISIIKGQKKSIKYENQIELIKTSDPGLPEIAYNQSMSQDIGDDQFQHEDSDDEYEGITKQIRMTSQQYNFSDNISQGNRQAPMLSNRQVNSNKPNLLIEDNKVGKEYFMDDLENLKMAKSMLASLKKASRYESESNVRDQESKEGNRNVLNQLKDLLKSQNKDFKLTTQMSHQMKLSNQSLDKLINTLSHSGILGITEDQLKQLQNTRGLESLQNIDQIDVATLLNSTNVSIKNLNHTLMKLVSVTQDSIVVTKGIFCNFQIMDCVPVFLEVNATGMPHPARIQIRADPLNNMNIPIQTLNTIIKMYTKIYVSTLTKTPTIQSNQMAVNPPTPKVLNFHPHCGSSAICNKQKGGKDVFDKIYIGINYDISQAKLEELHGQFQHLFPPGEKVDSKKIQELLGIINMQIMVRFPKDKEEIQKRKIAAMQKKISQQGSSVALIDLSGREGEQMINKINKELTNYYQQQKKNDRNFEQQSNFTSKLIQVQNVDSNSNMQLRTDSGQHMYYQELTNNLRNSPEPNQMTQRNDLNHNLNDLQFANNKEVVGAKKYNQLLDMYSLQIKQSQDVLQTAPNIEFYDENSVDTQSKEAEQLIANDYNAFNDDVLAAAHSNILNGPVDHIRRNAYISSKYKQMQEIRSQLNHDLKHARLYNSQQRALQNEDARRLKSEQWLKKWDDFRNFKMQHVEKALKILKARRKVINIISMIKLSQIIKGIIYNYDLIKAYNMRKFVEIMLAIRMYIRFQRQYKGHYGYSFDHRLRNSIRRHFSFQVQGSTVFLQQKSKSILQAVFLEFDKVQTVRSYFDRFINRIKFVQLAIKELKHIGRIKDNHAQLRILQEFMILKHFYMSQPQSNKLAMRIFERLQDVFENEVSQEIRALKNIQKDKKANFGQTNDSSKLASPIIQNLASHVLLYDQVCQKRYKLRVMESVQNQYALFLKYLEEDDQTDLSDGSASRQVISLKRENEFAMVRNNMINLFNRQKEMAQEIQKIETELYGIEDSQMVAAENNETQPQKTANTGQGQGQKKDKKGEPKEYDLKLAYKHLWSLYLETESKEFEALKAAAMFPNKRNSQQEMESLYEELLNDGDISSRSRAANQGGQKQQAAKKKKEKSDQCMMEILLNEEHRSKLRADRKQMIQLIQFLNNRPDRKINHVTATRLLNSKKECFRNAFEGVKLERREFDMSKIFILDEEDHKKFDFFDKFRQEVSEKGFDQIGVYMRNYKRFDMFKIIFKVLNIHQYMAPPQQQPADKDKEKKEKQDS